MCPLDQSDVTAGLDWWLTGAIKYDTTHVPDLFLMKPLPMLCLIFLVSLVAGLIHYNQIRLLDLSILCKCNSEHTIDINSKTIGGIVLTNETERILIFQCGETDLIQSTDSDVTSMNTMYQNVLLLFHRNLQWRIYVQKFPARPPNRTKFFRFYICFHRKAPVSEVGTPSNKGWRPPNGKSWIRP